MSALVRIGTIHAKDIDGQLTALTYRLVFELYLSSSTFGGETYLFVGCFIKELFSLSLFFFWFHRKSTIEENESSPTCTLLQMYRLVYRVTKKKKTKIELARVSDFSPYFVKANDEIIFR